MMTVAVLDKDETQRQAVAAARAAGLEPIAAALEENAETEIDRLRDMLGRDLTLRIARLLCVLAGDLVIVAAMPGDPPPPPPPPK